MTSPRYQNIAAEQIPEINRKDGVSIRVIAGEAGGTRGPVIDIFADPTYLDITIPANGTFSYPYDPDYAVFAYVFEGQGMFVAGGGQNGEWVSQPCLVVMGEAGFFEVRATEHQVRFLLISAKPLQEPIARYGPFVMNTPEEIQQALKDLKNGTFVRN